MAEKKDKDIILIQESVRNSIISDTYTMGSLFFVVLLAWWLDSTFLAVFGAAMWLLSAMAKAHVMSEKRRKSPQEAANYLKSEYGVTAHE